MLDGVKAIEKNILHTTKKLTEKIFVNCILKLKPYLAILFNGNGALLSDYNKIVNVVFQEKPDTSIYNEMNAIVKIKKMAINYLSGSFLMTHCWDLHDRKAKFFILNHLLLLQMDLSNR
ncbi:hypothetical protein IEQ34_019621 [Dendrobium chrysotoxum]|uniref:Uncharacterized protein n=1 Tax=Dendrobium chrysotoxum TaxID=161865 RepID=A0AAV7G7V4_DENCH|nr:hypothetical protein IEQ34_019621 [Dendrobium chrysotoxum]